jgi:hypothetical protein
MPSILREPCIRERRLRAGRRHQRGATLVEAAFMMPMFVILFFTSIFFHNLNAKQITLNVTTRAQAWTYAMHNCRAGEGQDEHEIPFAPASVAAPPSVATSGAAFQIQMRGNGSGGLSSVNSALSAGPIMNGISSVMGPIANFLSSIFADPQGSESFIADGVNWRMPNLYSKGNIDGANKNTPVQQTVIIACNEQAENGSVGNALSEIESAIGGF